MLSLKIQSGTTQENVAVQTVYFCGLPQAATPACSYGALRRGGVMHKLNFKFTEN